MIAAAARNDNQKSNATARARVVRGDFQTPPALATEVLRVIRRAAAPAGGFAAIVEPTCGQGSLLIAAAAAYPDTPLHGFDISPAYVAEARRSLSGRPAAIETTDFFRFDWDSFFARLPDPLLIVGNPPWVTNAALGALGARNLPAKHNDARRAGLAALTGASNFDISEAMLLRLLAATGGRNAVLAMLCKTSVARKVIERQATLEDGRPARLYGIDAAQHFGATVAASLLLFGGPAARGAIPVFADLQTRRASSRMAFIDGHLCADAPAYRRTRALAGPSEQQWRSGLKHDCSAVMELKREPVAGAPPTFRNGLGERVSLEPEFVFPLLKGSDLAKQRLSGGRQVIVTQHNLATDPATIRATAPVTWGYLLRHRARLRARKSRIYRGRPEFAMFGIGSYSFAPYKVAICGLYKQLRFVVVGPRAGKPVMFDDTCYFLPCPTRRAALAVARALNTPAVRAFFTARIFWDDKRPITKKLLAQLSLTAALRSAPRNGSAQ